MKKIIKGLIIIAITLLVSNFSIAMAYDSDTTQEKPNVGDVIGHIYETDIVADVDGMKIPSYNIGGETVIIAEDLKDYGFDVIWDEQNRNLKIYSKEKPITIPNYDPPQGRKSGTVIGDIYYTDIQTFANEYGINAFNIGGKTALSIEELSFANKPEGIYHSIYFNTSNSSLGYSDYMFKSFWDPNKRTISLYSLRPKMKAKTKNGEVTIDSIDYCSLYRYVYNFNFDGKVQTFLNDNSDICDGLGSLSYFDGLYPPKGNKEYFDLESLLYVFGLDYTFENNTLNIIGNVKDAKKREVSLDGGSNGSSIFNLPSIKISIQRNGKTLDIPDDELRCLIYYGKIYINTDLFAKAIGMKYSVNSSGVYEFSEIKN